MPNCWLILKASFNTLASLWFCAGNHKQQPAVRQGCRPRLPARNRSRCGPAAGTDCQPLPFPAGSLGTRGGTGEVPGNVCQRCKRVSIIASQSGHAGLATVCYSVTTLPGCHCPHMSLNNSSATALTQCARPMAPKTSRGLCQFGSQTRLGTWDIVTCYIVAQMTAACNGF